MPIQPVARALQSLTSWRFETFRSVPRSLGIFQLVGLRRSRRRRGLLAIGLRPTASPRPRSPLFGLKDLLFERPYYWYIQFGNIYFRSESVKILPEFRKFLQNSSEIMESEEFSSFSWLIGEIPMKLHQNRGKIRWRLSKTTSFLQIKKECSTNFC